MGVKFGLIKVDGLFLYCFFDYSVGKFVVVILLNKRKCYFFLDEFLGFWGRISGSKVSLFMNPRFGVMLYRRFGGWNFKIKLVEKFVRYFVNLVFVSSVFRMDIDYEMWFRRGSCLGSFSLVEGLEFFGRFYLVFCENLCVVLCREFSLFLFYFFFLFFFGELLWWFIIVFLFFKYFSLFFFVRLFSYFVRVLKDGVLVNKLNWLLSRFEIERRVLMQGTGALFDLVNLCFYLKQSVLGCDLLVFKKGEFDIFSIFKYFIFGLKRILGVFSFKHLWKIFKLLQGFFGVIGDYKSWGSAFLTLFDRFYSRSGIGFSLDGWRSLLGNFGYYYYLERDVVFSFWSVPRFRRFWKNFYWWWFRYLNIRSVSRSFFSFGLERVVGFRRVGRGLTKFWFICLYSIYFVLLILFFIFFFDYVISRSLVVFLFFFFRLFLVNMRYFFRIFLSGGVWVSRYRGLYFKVWLLLLENVFNSIKKYELVYSLLAFFMLFFFRFPRLESKDIRDLFKRLRLSELYFLFWYNFKYMVLYIWSWILVIYSAFFTSLSLLYYRIFSVRFLDNNEVWGRDSYLVGTLEVWENWKWFDMFRGNRHNIFRSFLGKDIKRLIDLNSISNLADVFWKRFIGGFGGIVGKENLNFGLFYRKSLVNWGSQFISFTLRCKRFGKIFGSGRSRLDYFWNYGNLILGLQKLRKVWPGLWFKLVKSYVYGVRIADILSVVNFGSEIYSEQLFKLVYRYIKPEVKVPQFYDPVFNMYRDWERRRSSQLGKLVIGWLRRRKIQQQIFDLQCKLLKRSDIGLGRYWYEIIFDRLLFQTKYYTLLRQIVKLPFYYENWKNININRRFFLFKDSNLQILWDLLKLYHKVKDFGINWLSRPILKENMRLKVLRKVSWQNKWKKFLKVGKMRYNLRSIKRGFDISRGEDKYNLVKAGLSRDFDSGLWRKGIVWKVGRRSLKNIGSFEYYDWKFSSKGNWGLERTFDDNVDKRFSRDSRFRRNVDKRFSHDSRFRKDVGSEFDTKFNKKFRDFGVVRKFTNRFGAKFAKGEGKNRLTNSSLKRFK